MVRESKNKKEPGAMGKLIKVEHGLVFVLHSSTSFYLLFDAIRCKYAHLNLDITSKNLLNANILVVFIETQISPSEIFSSWTLIIFSESFTTS